MPPIGFAFETILKILELGRTVMFSIRFNRWTIAAVTSAALALPGSLLAQTPDHPADNSAQFPTSRDLKSLTVSGNGSIHLDQDLSAIMTAPGKTPPRSMK